MATKIPPHELSYLIKEHLDQILELDARSCTYFDEDLDIETVHPHAWTQQALLEFLQQRTPPTHGYVLTTPSRRKKIIGYMAYEMRTSDIHLLGFAVDPEFRGKGYGTAMLLKLYPMILQSGTRKTITVHIREHDDASIGFFVKMKFKSRLKRAYFSDGEDAIEFWFRETKNGQ